MEESEKDKLLKRRDFMSKAIGAMGGFIGLSLGLPAVAYVISPSLAKDTAEEWVRMGSTSKVEPGIPTLFKTKIVHQTGWTTKEEDLTAYLLTENGSDFVALSNICTHLGCRVRWADEEALFVCPCHTAAFNIDGSVSAGPPPKALDKYEIKVENDQIYILVGG